ncbi:glycosyltransferase [Pseudomonas sp. ZM23]|uniref:Glycosyltransferase n=1 Tax=Pseudomonas triclosanedens TaxID=2961893 RepID=A0ABY7A2U4_9PSED|nr:glycosyltransferase [Pseudomonas triclosanedens]MCP8464853.1 glycosyltransferase [Pseudomonas triclosanedens]MCP8470434.1 glycosyltransferase [Pseudomonas triclosanedens]MCP8476240.1 glycosyltransferase [Pseudomonas triclosanedens]WAI51527.1 glycosyltransferase [Pseudomonas triclosanedens]
MSQPTVSVFIPSYNYERYIAEAIDSILAQTWQDWELVIVDDASTDGSRALIERYVERYPQKIRAHFLEQNGGQARSARLGLQLCRGRYISFLAADDVATPQRLEQGVALLDSRPDVAAAFSRVGAIDAQGRELQVETVFNKDFSSMRQELLAGNFLCATSTIARRDVLLAEGAWNSELRAVEDYDLWVRLLARHELVRVDEVWVKYRLHDSNLSSITNLDGVRANARYETLMVALSAIDLWPIEKIFDFVHAPGTAGHELEVGAARLSLARHCLQLDQQYCGRPLLGTGKAYALALQVSLATPDHPELPGVLAAIYAALGDQPRAHGERSMLARDWLAQPRSDAPCFSYDRWIAERVVDESAPSVEALVQHLAPAFDFRIEILAADGAVEAVERTLASLARQQGGFNLAVRVHGLTEAPRRVAGLAIECCPQGEEWVERINTGLQDAPSGWLVLLEAGDQLVDHALVLLAERAQAEPGMACCYFDQDQLVDGVPSAPVFKPDFNLDLLRSYPYVGACVALDARALSELGGLNPEHGRLATVDLFLRAAETRGLDSIGHIAEVLVHGERSLGQWLTDERVVAEVPRVVSAHLQRLGVPHRIEPGVLPMINRVTYDYPEQPLVSILVPTRDQLPLLQRCVESLLDKTRYRHYELLIIDNGSQDADAVQWLAGIDALDSEQVRVLRYPQPFNFSAMNNFAARQARGEYLVLLNNDTAIIDGGWLDALLNHARRPEVGVVGAKLYYPDGRIQHGGVVLGLNGPADHPFMGAEHNAPGYMHRLLVDQNYSAVTAACLMIRRSLYDDVQGMDEVDFKVSYNDVDLCLKAREAGYLAVWTPYAEVLHEGSVSQKHVDPATQAQKAQRFQGEQQAMYRKWLPLLARDPAYNRNLSLGRAGFEVELTRNLAWQPFSQPLRPRVLCYPADHFGCGHYRVRQPFQSLLRQDLIEGALSENLLDAVELARFEADVVVYQRQTSDAQLASIERTRGLTGAFRVYELDDYLPNLPMKNLHREEMPKDVLRSLRRAVSMMDRFVVSTAPLAEAFADLHADIRVMPNRLPVDWWGGLSSQRRVGRKPRVGWAGGVGHSGDLELIADVVRDLAGEVEWVFFGLCPDKLRPYIHEWHPGVAIADYPARLASLNLDLALAPLEQNRFNECKSNLRLLEYGVLGFPVICSDILPYRGDLPVTLVKNRYRDWVDAIRAHLADLDAAARAGDALREAVRRNWMLDGANLHDWARVWLPD